MRYVMKQKMFAVRDQIAIRNEKDEDVFLVNGKLFSIGKKLSFQDAQGNEVLFIKQKVPSLTPTYEIFKNGQPVASVKKEMLKLKPTFAIKVDGGKDMTAQGSLTDHEYSMTRDGAEVAHISRKWFSVADTYGVDVQEGEDPALILACTVAIDMSHHQK